VNALAKPEVGAYLNRHYVSAFQKVATFRIVNGQKQGGNVAAYFCAPDGRVLHVVAGPVDGATMLREAKWVVETAKAALQESKSSGTPFKVLFRKRHAERLRLDHGLIVDVTSFDAPVKDEDDPLTYGDPTGREFMPVLPPPPIDGPDVSLRSKQADEEKASGAREMRDRHGRRWVLGNQGRVHQILAAYAMIKIERVYGTVFENILGEKVSTKPVITVRNCGGRGTDVCLKCD